MSIQSKAAALEWQRFRDSETYYPLRDGPRLQRSVWVITTQERYLPSDQVALAQRLAAVQAHIGAGHGRGGHGEATERVQGGEALADRDVRMLELGELIRELAGFQAASLRVGRDGYGCFRGICLMESQAQVMRRVRYPQGSVGTFRRLVQITMNALQDHADRHPLDAERNTGAYSRA